MSNVMSEEKDTYSFVSEFMRDFNQLHDSYVEKLSWKPSSSTIELHIHDLFNQYFDSSKYRGKQTGKLKFLDCVDVAMDLNTGTSPPSLCITDVLVEESKIGCRIRFRFTSGKLAFVCKSVNFPGIDKHTKVTDTN